MGAKGPLSRTLAKILSKFANYSPQCVIVKSTPVRVTNWVDLGSPADSCWTSLHFPDYVSYEGLELP